MTPNPHALNPAPPALGSKVATRAWYHRVQSLTLCVMFQVLLPLIPLVVEKMLTSDVKPKTVGLLAGMYVIGLGLGAKTPIVWGGGLLSGLVLVAALGVADGQSGISNYPELPVWLIFFMVISFICDRVHHHLVLGNVFPPFEKE